MDSRHLVDKDVETSRVDIGTLFWSIAGKMQTEPAADLFPSLQPVATQDNKILKVSADPFKITTGTVQRLTGAYSVYDPYVAKCCRILHTSSGYHLFCMCGFHQRLQR